VLIAMGHFRFFDLRAVFKAIAIACFLGLPAASSVLMFWPIAFLLLPFISGIL